MFAAGLFCFLYVMAFDMSKVDVQCRDDIKDVAVPLN